MDDVNPADDPNNQGEDEFEEAEQEREENLPDENKQIKTNNQKQGNPGMEENLVVSMQMVQLSSDNLFACASVLLEGRNFRQ